MSWLSLLDKRAETGEPHSVPKAQAPRASNSELTKRPRHLAIILDGNGRWASSKCLPRTAGHVKGVESVRELVDGCLEFGIEALSLYTFSTLNWKRPEEEVKALMNLLQHYLEVERTRLISEGVRIRWIGERGRIPASVAQAFDKLEADTASNKRLLLNLAVNYGGREELVHAVKALAAQAQKGELKPESIDQCQLEENLFTHGLPPVDLLIRTAGERRLSNFLLWQSAYAELLFMDVLWPDFTRSHLEMALSDYATRRRTFGGLVDLGTPGLQSSAG